MLLIYKFLRLQIPGTCSPPKPHIYSTYNGRLIWNPVKQLWCSLFCGINVLRPLAIFANEFYRVFLTNSKCHSAQWFIITRRRSEEKLSTIRVTRGNLRHPCLLILLIYTKNNKKSWADAASSFPRVTPITKTIKSWNNHRDISLPWNSASVPKSHRYHLNYLQTNTPHLN